MTRPVPLEPLERGGSTTKDFRKAARRSMETLALWIMLATQPRPTKGNCSRRMYRMAADRVPNPISSRITILPPIQATSTSPIAPKAPMAGQMMELE